MGQTLCERLAAIRQDLAKLRRIDVALRVHGAHGSSGHGHRARPPVTHAELRELEVSAGIELPEPFRRFLCEVASGGAGPGYGLPSIDALLDASSSSQLQLPFAIDCAARDAVIEARVSKTDPCAFVNLPPDDRRGVLQLSHGGCGWYTVLVIEGPMRGQVWDAGDLGWCPHFDEATGAPLSFLQWYERWLARALAMVQAPPSIDADATDVNLQGRLNAEIPDEVWRVTGAERLDLRNNALTRVPDDLGRLRQLRRLRLSSNRLASLPAVLWSLAGLQQLELDRNELSELPPRLGELSTLVALSVSGNPLQRLPDLSTLTKLQRLNLSATALRALPSGLGHTDLTHLVLNDTMLESFESLAGCNDLRRLDLSRAGLTELPPSVCGLRALTTLHVSRNPLRVLPNALVQLQHLTTLSVSFAPLDRLPDCIASMPALRRVVAIDTPLSPAERDRWTRRRPDVRFIFERAR